jgi:hypothetical protein
MHTSTLKVVIYTMTCYMLRPITWPSSGWQNTKDEYIKDKITEIREQIHTHVWIDVWIGFGTSAI